MSETREPSTRERIVEGARRCFGRLGYAATRVEDILQESNVSRPTFYRVFRNKDEVYAEISPEAAPQPRTARERVLEGAREAFGRLGYEQTRVEDILEAASVSRPTFYRVFSSKQEAYEELDRMAVTYLQRAMEQLDPSNDTKRDLLYLVIASYFEWRIGLRLGFDATAIHSPGLTHARRTLYLGHDSIDSSRAILISSLLSAVEVLASSWASVESMTSEAIHERRLMATELVMRALLPSPAGREKGRG